MGDAGINVYISECDVYLYGAITEKTLQLQADAYKSMFKACMEATNCKALFTDEECWRPVKEKRAEPCSLVFEP